MSLRSVIVRALINGVIAVAKDPAREQARDNRGNRTSSRFPDPHLPATKYAVPMSNVNSLRKAMRMVGIIDGILERDRDEWIPWMRGTISDSALQPTMANISQCVQNLYAYLKSQGFPCDTDTTFWTTVTEIHSELMFHKAFPEAWAEWNEDFDNRLERAATEAKRMVGERRMEILAKIMPDGRVPAEDNVLAERLSHAVLEFLAQVIVPQLVSFGLIPEDNPLFAQRLGILLPKVLLEDMVEFIGELSQPVNKK